ncbi:sugar-phosphatase [Apilactobacillus apisilvae]|uniref:Sugar-phosphatase n=1 Tax=Apilactobacillus apisilvae TaxID=2923364 RepID=A0ABY4PHD5_9LACO|nr:sugar-phosphatase [Apilactobacillus apisilvae]UQS84992.1 sugar-phosphatase [Apilactobacillus apisilvae]
MKNIKLIAIDIDGTLLNEENVLAQETIDAITEARQKGIKVVLCTGRPLTGVKKYLKQLNISGHDEYAITFNGSQVQNADGQIIEKTNITHEDFLELEKLSHKLGTNFQIETADCIYATNRDLSPYSIAESYLVNMPIKVRKPEEIDKSIEVVKAMLIADPSVIDSSFEKISNELFERFAVVKSTPVFIEFMNKNSSKGNALDSLAKDLNLTADNVMAIGDQNNDMSMIKYAGTGVAMGNGVDELKTVANKITKTNKENGVAYAIRNFVLNK